MSAAEALPPVPDLWRPAPAPDVEPFGVVELYYDHLDELETIFEAGAEAAETDRRIGWPDNEPERWN